MSNRTWPATSPSGPALRNLPLGKPRRFSSIRSFVLADVLTLGNGFCGAGAVLALMQYLVSHENCWLITAMALLPVALML